MFIADRDPVVFRYAAEHSGPTVRAFLKGFHGTLLADAAPIYDVLYREESKAACSRRRSPATSAESVVGAGLGSTPLRNARHGRA